MGRGRPVLLLHGLGGSKISFVPLLAPLADARHQVIVPDMPGHGESEKPRTEYSPRFFARVVRHLMDELGIERAAVVGNSMGGRIALELALRSPNRVESLALLDAAVPGLKWRSVIGFTRGKACSRDAPVPYVHDGADAVALIDWISRQPWSDGHVGMYGGSYSGMSPWGAAKGARGKSGGGKARR